MTGHNGQQPSRYARIARSYTKVLTPRALWRRVRIGIDIFRDHQFERYSPITPLPDALRAAIGGHEITLPPARHVGGEGSQTIEGMIFLASLARSLDARTVFEIGTFKGVTTWTIARNLDARAEVHTLDLPYDRRASLELSELDQANRMTPPERLFDRLPTSAGVTQHWDDSATFDFTPFHGRCDLVYIDGAHTKPYVERDTDNGIAMLAERGAIVWDDYWRQEPGVRDVLEALDLRPLYRVPGTRLVLHLTPEAERRLGSET